MAALGRHYTPLERPAEDPGLPPRGSLRGAVTKASINPGGECVVHDPEFRCCHADNFILGLRAGYDLTGLGIPEGGTFGLESTCDLGAAAVRRQTPIRLSNSRPSRRVLSGWSGQHQAHWRGWHFGT